MALTLPEPRSANLRLPGGHLIMRLLAVIALNIIGARVFAESFVHASVGWVHIRKHTRVACTGVYAQRRGVAQWGKRWRRHGCQMRRRMG
jgi:hypothetical protein